MVLQIVELCLIKILINKLMVDSLHKISIILNIPNCWTRFEKIISTKKIKRCDVGKMAPPCGPTTMKNKKKNENKTMGWYLSMVGCVGPCVFSYAVSSSLWNPTTTRQRRRPPPLPPPGSAPLCRSGSLPLPPYVLLAQGGVWRCRWVWCWVRWGGRCGGSGCPRSTSSPPSGRRGITTRARTASLPGSTPAKVASTIHCRFSC